ncbi:MAG TPA: hypothetical protein VF337_11940 [Candidatus Limnocylindrales bacterium]
MRVRRFELRLLAVALTILWAVGGVVVLVAYRPGGPLDVLVGSAALLPLFVSVASVVWPPLVRSNRGSAGVFWLGLIAGLLLIPCIFRLSGQVIQGGTEPLLPSLEVVYPWLLALIATSLFAGLGISRQFIAETAYGRRHLFVTLAFALAATTIIGGAFAGVSLADDAALRDRPAAHSRFGPTDMARAAVGTAPIEPPDCDKAFVAAGSGRIQLDLSANVDARAVGTVSLSGTRSGSDFAWTARVVRSDVLAQYGAVRIGDSAWTEAPRTGWATSPLQSVGDRPLDETAIDRALSTENRATAENRGLEYVESARARRCRINVDGATFVASFPQVKWLVGTASLETWRGQLDYWVFLDGEVGMVSGTINGDAEEILPHGIQATVWVKMIVTDRDSTIAITPPGN